MATRQNVWAASRCGARKAKSRLSKVGVCVFVYVRVNVCVCVGVCAE